MKYDFLGVIVFGIVLLIGVAVIAAFITVGIFLIRALSRYVKSGNVRKEKSSIKKSLGEVLKQHREECKMTQEFVAESIGVSRQAVSNGRPEHLTQALPICLYLQNCSTLRQKNYYVKYNKRVKRM